VTALGIVVAELVTNSFDHAFPGGTGSTTVSVRYDARAADMAIMTVSDNGTGFKVNGASKRQGIGLVRRLIEQVRGTVMLDSDHGTVWTIRFPTVIAPEPERSHLAAV
jgi:two-component sensor histidine kinase